MNNHFIHIGDIEVTLKPKVYSTVLGSCVSICLFDPVLKAGGIIHFALPVSQDVESKSGRYGDYAITELIKRLEKVTGNKSSTFLAKVVGGAQQMVSDNEIATVGEANIKLAFSLLSKLGVRVVGQDTGGKVGRKILFHTDTHRVQVAPINSEETLIDRHKKIRVLIVDDSKTVRDILRKTISSDSSFEIVGLAESAREAMTLITQVKPDVMTLDIHMPGMDGVTFLGQLLPKQPIPTIMVTALSMEEGGLVLRALELGAVDYIQKPDLAGLSQFAPSMCEKIKAASRAKVRCQKKVINRSQLTLLGNAHEKIIAMGASTGGTEALKDVLVRLPANIPPMVIVQHIPPVFSKAFAERLDSLCAFEVKEAQDGDILRQGLALVAPGGKQMKIIKSEKGLVIKLTDDPPVNRHRPSVDYLFDSVANICAEKAVGIILTGMGNDGAKGLLKMRQRGAWTFGQDEASSVVYGMPKVAFEVGGVEEVGSLEDCPGAILKALTRKSVPRRTA